MNSKLILIFAIICCSCFTSCKKDYTCTCTWQYNGADSIVQPFTYHETKSKAAEACKAQQALAASGTILVVTCHL